MTGLLGPNGRPISSADVQNKKAAPPVLGERYGRWAGPQVQFMTLPGGGTIAFDTSQLTLADLRQMRGHYQINSSLSVLTFMMHQMGWHIECENKKIADLVEEQLSNVWSRLVRAKSQALWAGYSPNVLEWENDSTGQQVVLNKIKDLIPEDCRVHWKKISNPVPGAQGAQATFSLYDGIDQWGGLRPIPVDNSYWYPLLMENGNYYGKRILESAFQPWFFSTLMHLFANRYYERFGEPLPVGRAPYDDEIDVNGASVKGNELMAMIIQSLRSRSTVVLPNDRTSFDGETRPGYDYTLEYLESQMRGADFERYMTRLDEEMSLAMFTPLLMMRTADVGSYNLGTQHTQVYQWMLNALSGDWSEYINKYILRPIVNFNFGVNAPDAKINFTTLGKTNSELLNMIIQTLLSSDKAKIDVREIGEMAGLTLTEIQQTTGADPNPAPPEQKPNPNGPAKAETPISEIGDLIVERVNAQVTKAFANRTFGDAEEFQPKMGYKRQLVIAMRRQQLSAPEQRADDVYEAMDDWLSVSCSLGVDEFKSAENFMGFFKAKLDNVLEVFTR